MTSRGILCWLAVTIGLTLAGPQAAAAKTTKLKIATLAPEGSAWWKLMTEAAKRLRDMTGGRVKVRIYAGGVAGDEVDVVRKMRIGQIHGAAITSVGLSEIQPALLVLQAPGLFASWEELDYVRHKLHDRFADLLGEKGFVTFMWGDVGFNRIFANRPIRRPADLKPTKIWCWTQDAMMKYYFEGMGLRPVLVGAPEVLPGLQTGLLDSFSAPPLIAINLQWVSRTKYVLDEPQSVTIGSVVLTQKALAGLSQEDQNAIAVLGREFAPRLSQVVREDNQKAIDAIRLAGLTVLKADEAGRARWAQAAREAAQAAAGEVYPADLLAAVMETIAQYRESHGK